MGLSVCPFRVVARTYAKQNEDPTDTRTDTKTGTHRLFFRFF